MIEQIPIAYDAVEELVDAVELWVEDQDDDAAEFLEENARYVFDEVPVLALLSVIEDEDGT